MSDLEGSVSVSDEGKEHNLERVDVEKSKENLGKERTVKSNVKGHTTCQENVGVEKKKENKWKLHQIERFLELYELHHCLWDYKSADYKDRNVKEGAWEAIIRDMKMDGFTVKKAKNKIRVLRNTYSNELRKITKSKPSGGGLEDVYTPTLRWFSTMDRILGTVVQTRGSQTVGLPEEQSHKQTQDKLVENEDEETEIQEDEESILSTSPDNHSASAGENSRIRREKASTAYQQPTSPYKRPVSNKTAAERFNKIDSAVKELKDISNKVLAPENDPVQTPCEYELFGQLVTTQLKKLPELNALSAMQQIQSYILEQRMSVLSPSPQMQFQQSTWHDNFSSTTTTPAHSPDLGECISGQGNKD